MWHQHVYDRGEYAPGIPTVPAPRYCTKSCNSLKPDKFLSMHFLGPLAILSKGHMENFGFHAVALTISQAWGWDKKGDDKENPALIYLWSFNGFYKAWMLFPTTGRRRKKYRQMGKSRSKS